MLSRDDDLTPLSPRLRLTIIQVLQLLEDEPSQIRFIVKLDNTRGYAVRLEGNWTGWTPTVLLATLGYWAGRDDVVDQLDSAPGIGTSPPSSHQRM
jgi:hypothetical protein